MRATAARYRRRRDRRGGLLGRRGRWGRGGVVADGGLLTGTAHYVLDGEFADVLLVVARSGGQTTLHEVAADADGVTRTPVPLMDPTRALCTVTFDETPSTVIPSPADLVERLLAVGAVALSAEQVGVAAGALQRTVSHTSTRTQFGRPVGSFQALKHRMADMFAAVETARSVSYDAVDALVRALSTPTSRRGGADVLLGDGDRRRWRGRADARRDRHHLGASTSSCSSSAPTPRRCSSTARGPTRQPSRRPPGSDGARQMTSPPRRASIAASTRVLTRSFA